MKVKILSGVCVGNGKDALPGETLDLTDALARELIQSGRAKPIAQKEKDAPPPKDPAL